MDEKYCIKHTKMNKKGHFAYNLGICLGLLRVSYGFDSRREYQNDCEDSRFFTPNGESNGCWHSPIPVRSAGSLLYGSTKTTVKTVVFIWWRERADDSGRIKKISTRAAFFSLSIILLLNVFWFLNQSMPDKNNTNRGQDVVFLTNTALRSRLRHKVLTRSRALSLPENTASDSRATKSSQNRTKIKKRSEKIDQ